MTDDKYADMYAEPDIPQFVKLPEPDPSPFAHQVGGDHYKGMKIGPAEYCHRNHIGFIEGSAIKYLSRHRKKNGAEDVKKAIHFCKLLLSLEYGIEE